MDIAKTELLVLSVKSAHEPSDLRDLRDLRDTGAMLCQLSYEATHWERCVAS